MKLLTIAVLSANIFTQTQAAEPIGVQSPAITKAEIRAILDQETKQTIDTNLVITNPFVAPVQHELLARETKRSRNNRFSSLKIAGDE
jgi:hypothetical protein